MQEIKFGDVTVTRVVEYHGDTGTSPEDITPCIPVKVWQGNRSWLQPDHVNADFTRYIGALQTWVLRSEGKTILIDTGAGNGRDRPLPTFAHLHTSFLADLAAAGVVLEEVDVVINTHLHLDHTGWNTRLEDGQWIPTFPNARYLMPEIIRPGRRCCGRTASPLAPTCASSPHPGTRRAALCSSCAVVPTV